MPRASICLSICFRCKPEGWIGRDDKRPGACLADAIVAEASRRGIDIALVRDVRFMSQCKRPCVVAFSGEDRFTYLFGDLNPARDAAAPSSEARQVEPLPRLFGGHAETIPQFEGDLGGVL